MFNALLFVSEKELNILSANKTFLDKHYLDGLMQISIQRLNKIEIIRSIYNLIYRIFYGFIVLLKIIDIG